jgi:hypothetical protein
VKIKKIIKGDTFRGKSINPVFYLSLIATACILLISAGNLNSWDTVNRLQVTHSLWMNVPQVKAEERNKDHLYVVSGRDGNDYVTWGIGQSLVMLPADIISYNLTSGIDKPEAILDKIRSAIVAYLTFTPINVLSIIVSFYFIRNLSFSNKQSIFGALTLLFGTSFLAYAQGHQENSLLFLVTISGYALTVKWILSGSKLMLLLSSIVLGFSILVRITGILDIASVFLFVLLLTSFQSKVGTYNWYSLRKKTLEYVFTCAPVYLFYLGLDRLYHWMRFGTLLGTYSSIWATQYKALHPNLPPSFPFSTPFEVGFFGALFSPERSIFLFNPLIIVTLVLSIKYWNHIDPIVKAFILANMFLLLANISAYAKWFLWGGAAAWGPRYLTTPMQMISCLSIPLLIKIYPHIKRGVEKTFYKIIFALSLVIQLTSVAISCSLETSQVDDFHKPIAVVLQRVLNIVGIITGNFEKWGLMPHNITADETHNFLIPRFMPWTIADDMPGFVSDAARILWFGGLIGAILLIIVFVKNTANGTYDGHNERSKER